MLAENVSFFHSFSGESGAGSWVSIGEHVSKTPIIMEAAAQREIHWCRELFCTPRPVHNSQSPFVQARCVHQKIAIKKCHSMENKFMILILQHSFEIVIYVVWSWLSEAGDIDCSKSIGSLDGSWLRIILLPNLGHTCSTKIVTSTSQVLYWNWIISAL